MTDKFHMTKRQTRWWYICEIAHSYFALDCEKDFFQLTPAELYRLDKLSLTTNYKNSQPSEGRSTLRQLWYDLQKWNTTLDTPF